MCNNDEGLYFFISDVHLGLDVFNPKERERRFANILFSLPKETKHLYLLGDIFDFWYEYKYVIPRGFTRTLGALAYLNDRGVKLYFIKGNHDVWTYNYLQKELGVTLLEEMSVVEIADKRFCLAHGDELIGERKHLFLKKMFKNRVLQVLFSALHPRWAFGIANCWSKHNRLVKNERVKFRGKEDPLYRYAAEFEKTNEVDYFIFGHMHTPGEVKTPKGAQFYILGEWIEGCQYLVFDGKSKLLTWEKGCHPIIS